MFGSLADNQTQIVSLPLPTVAGMTEPLAIDRPAASIHTPNGWVQVPPVPQCPHCGATWSPSAGVLPGPMPCSCTRKYGEHPAWRCTACPAIVAEDCDDVHRWDSVHVELGAIRYTAWAN